MQEEMYEIAQSNNRRLGWIAFFCAANIAVAAVNMIGLHECWKELKALNAAVADMRKGG